MGGRPCARRGARRVPVLLAELARLRGPAAPCAGDQRLRRPGRPRCGPARGPGPRARVRQPPGGAGARGARATPRRARSSATWSPTSAGWASSTCRCGTSTRTPGTAAGRVRSSPPQAGLGGRRAARLAAAALRPVRQPPRGVDGVPADQGRGPLRHRTQRLRAAGTAVAAGPARRPGERPRLWQRSRAAGGRPPLPEAGADRRHRRPQGLPALARTPGRGGARLPGRARPGPRLGQLLRRDRRGHRTGRRLAVPVGPDPHLRQPAGLRPARSARRPDRAQPRGGARGHQRGDLLDAHLVAGGVRRLRRARPRRPAGGGDGEPDPAAGA